MMPERQLVVAGMNAIKRAIENFQWTLPLFVDAHDNDMSDDAAEAVHEQIMNRIETVIQLEMRKDDTP